MFRILDHTADLAIEAEGDTAGECLSSAAQALACILTGRRDLHGVRPDDEVVFHVDAPDLQMLAVACLSEILWLFEDQSILWVAGGADVEPLPIDPPAPREPWTRGTDRLDFRASARGNAVLYDPTRHGQGVEVKAVTYSDLRFGQENGRWRLYVVVDI